MRREHFETLAPVCPVCRGLNATEFPLRLAHIEREADGHIIEGALHCSNADCQREFPILDGIPIIVANIRQYVSENISAIYARRDVSDFAETILGDCCGPNSPFDATRQHLSSYTWDHYGDLDPRETSTDPRPGSMRSALRAAREIAGELPPGPILDVGCSVGRSTFDLAEGTDELVLGIDLHFPMLRLAAEALRGGVVRYSRRSVGVVYHRREFPVHFAGADRVDFWACDATALPFPAATFSFAPNMNVLDCLHAPHDFLVSLANVLKPGGKTVIACPYDWSPNATAVEAWLGGHSQRSPVEGSSETVLRTLLTPGAHQSSINALKLSGERDGIPWHVRLHDRSTMTYKLDMVAATRTPQPATASRRRSTPP
ncbi:MAG: methyltransferase domain-containing protein [Gemmatimonadaceae bacterium]